MLHTSSPIRVLVADDHPFLRRGVIMALQSYEDVDVVGEAENGAQAVHLCQQLRPDIVLMDLTMPEMDGITATAQLTEQQLGVKIIALTSFNEDSLIMAALRAGVVNYLVKSISPDELVEAIRAAHRGQPQYSADVSQALVEDVKQNRPLTEKLTQREKEVLLLMTEGRTNDEIGQALYISLATVKKHVHSILDKLNVSNRTEAVSLAIRHNLIV